MRDYAIITHVISFFSQTYNIYIATQTCYKQITFTLQHKPVINR